MSIKQKIFVYLGLLALLVIVLGLWAYFAYHGKADTGAFIAQLGGLVTIIIAALGALGGFHSGQSGNGIASTFLTAGEALLAPPQSGVVSPAVASTAVPAPVAQPPQQ